jgi:hypothetical protein
MRLGLTALFVALLLAAIAGQNSLLQSTEAQDNPSTAITACAVQGERCAQPPLDSSPASVVLEHRVLSQGCQTSDLHVVRYVPSDSASGDPVVAQWCASP